MIIDKYKARHIQFKEVFEVNDWRIKMYTISKQGDFDVPVLYKNAKARLPEWLDMNNSFDATNDKIGFLILHAGTEGIFSIINWWVGGNMLNTHIFISSPKQPSKFTKISGDGLSPCIWELEVINHERISWTNNILKAAIPDFSAYLNEVYNGWV